MAEIYNTTNKARLHQYHGDEQPHVRVRRTSPEDMSLQISLHGKRAVTLHLDWQEAEIIGKMLLHTAKELRDYGLA